MAKRWGTLLFGSKDPTRRPCEKCGEPIYGARYDEHYKCYPNVKPSSLKQTKLTKEIHLG